MIPLPAGTQARRPAGRFIHALNGNRESGTTCDEPSSGGITNSGSSNHATGNVTSSGKPTKSVLNPNGSAISSRSN